MAKKIRPEKTASGYYRQGTRTMNDGTTGYNPPVRTVKGLLAGATSVDKATKNRKSSFYTNPPVSSRKTPPTDKEKKSYEKFKAKTYGDFRDITPGAYTPKEKKGGPITALNQVQDMYSKMYSKNKK